MMRGNPLLVFACILLAGLILLALFGAALAPFDPQASNVARALQPPSALHWFGTDHLGRDILSRVMVATRIDLLIAASAVGIAFLLGGPLGVLLGYRGGMLDNAVSRVVDMLMAFPMFVMAMALVAAFGNSVANIVYATALINLPFYIRIARAEAGRQRHSGYVLAARLSGNNHGRIVLAVLLPNILPILLVQMSLNMGWAILNAAGLSFIGLGVRPPMAEWGIMVAEGAAQIAGGRWWPALFPGLALALAVLCFNLLGDGLRDLLDPRQRR
ncbi:ABC transporter permease [Ferrovibrio sp.]|uniref:ABC transporter permease n=1 Tax=Ferrovibrio sp. TaxID=1917215 RepID=UPI0025BE4C6E|nr:ABC transporter permease [Ferrovibrio sp.]MBX3453006.1 ABC transporter permease [Ferrovibrio sp.]